MRETHTHTSKKPKKEQRTIIGKSPYERKIKNNEYEKIKKKI